VTHVPIILILHIAATSVMFGVIWVVQLVIYPGLSRIKPDTFIDDHRRYTNLVGFIVGPAMLVEAITAGVLLSLTDGFVFNLLLAGACLLQFIWISTAFLQVPCHRQLSRGFQAPIHRRLVMTNWIRTVFWSVRWVLVLIAGCVFNC
jgi:hypothetical protein